MEHSGRQSVQIGLTQTRLSMATIQSNKNDEQDVELVRISGYGSKKSVKMEKQLVQSRRHQMKVVNNLS